MSISKDEILMLPNAAVPRSYDRLYILRSVPGVVAYTKLYSYGRHNLDIIFGLKSQWDYEEYEGGFLVNHRLLPEFVDSSVIFGGSYLTPNWSWQRPQWHKSYSYRYDGGNFEYILEQFSIIKDVYYRNRNKARSHARSNI